MAKLKKGCIQIYTGNGKGKTTAATGLAIRAAGAGLRVLIYRFMKGRPTSEDAILRTVQNISVRRCGKNTFVCTPPLGTDRVCAAKGLKEVKACLAINAFDVIILDEINVAISMGLIDRSEMVHIMTHKPDGVELIMTGRGCPRSLYKHADLVSDVHAIRHPYTNGLKARRGIDH